MKLRVFSISFFFLLIFFSQIVFAQKDLAKRYFEETRSVLLSLKNADIEKMACTPSGADCLTPDDLLTTLDTVKFVVTQEFAKPQNATRFSAFYSPTESTIYLNANIKHEQSTLGFIGLHELLGIEGKNDSEFRISLASYEFLKVAEKKWGLDKVETLKNEIGTEFFEYSTHNTDILNSNNQMSFGGATIIGGGGDSRAFVQRILLLDYFSKVKDLKGATLNSSFIEYIIRIPIEVVDSKNSNIIYIKNQRSETNTTGWPVHILVPDSLTSLPPVNDTKASNRAIEEIVNYISFLNIPSYEKNNFKYKYSSLLEAKAKVK